jgi:hypothetical protein
MGFVLAVSYFMIPVLLGGLICLPFFVGFVALYVCICALAAAVFVGFPLGAVAWLATARVSGWLIPFLAFAAAGAGTAAVACGIVAAWLYGVFQPLEAFGAHSAAGTIVLISFTAACSSLGWLTVDRQGKSRSYEDALRGHSIDEFVELLEAHREN